MNTASLDDWLVHLESLHPTVMELGLDRVRTVADRLGLLPPVAPVITVAGTNGKGSTVVVLESLLRNCGHRPGCFTSPHFLRFNERIRVAGDEVPDEAITSAFTVIEAAREDVSLTYFEFATLAALWVFAREGVDIAVLEVGLGGRLDSVNMVDPAVSVITSIDLDHQEWLGNSRGAIAREKAGILRAGVPAVLADTAPPPELLDAAASVGADPIYLIGREFTVTEGESAWEGTVSLRGGGLSRVGGATGALLPVNICAALQAAAAMGIGWSPEQVHKALEQARSVGRRQQLTQAGRHYLLDVAHNPAAIDKLLQAIAASPCNGKIIALFSAMKDKAVVEMLAPLRDTVDAWFLADQPDNPRALPAAQLADLLRAGGQEMISVSKNLTQAFRRAQLLMDEGDLLVVFGSFFTVAAVLPLLEKDRSRGGSV